MKAEVRQRGGATEMRIFSNGVKPAPEDGWATISEWDVLLAKIDDLHKERPDHG
ncbi:hypothetical protein ATER59S_01679 [Aquamicrobium terrae]